MGRKKKFVEVYDKRGRKIGELDAKLFADESGMKPLRVYLLSDNGLEDDARIEENSKAEAGE